MAEPKLNLLTVNFLYSFISSALGLLLPLYMFYKGFNTAEIGFILAILPLITIFARTVFAIVGDIIGTNAIFRISGVSTIAALFAYVVASSSAAFSLGKILEGFCASSFWAVNRTEIYRLARYNDKGDDASIALGVRALGEFLARIISGLSIALFGFFNAFLALFFFGFAYLYYTLRVDAPKAKQNEKITVDALKRRLLSKRSKEFWQASAICGMSAPLDALPLFLFPLFFVSAFDMSTAEIGVLIALYPISYAVTSLLSAKYDLRPAKVALIPLILIVFPLLLTFYTDKLLAYAIVILVGLGSGFEGFSYEHIIARGVKGSKALSTDIAIIHIPFRTVQALAYIYLGWAASAFGFYIAFATIALIILIYSTLSFFFLNRN